MRDLPKLKLDLKEPQNFGNLAEKLSVEERRQLANDLIELIGIDEQSMSDFLGEARGYLDEVEADRGNEIPQNREQEGSGEEPPPSTELTLSAVIQFSARATDALLGEPDLAKASEPDDGNIALAAWVSSQLRTKDPNWTLDTDPLVVHMGVTGLAWRKRDFDDYDKVFHSYFRPCTNVIINSNVRSIERAPRVTDDFERYPYEIERSIERGHWVDYEPRYDENDPQAPKRFYECDAWLDLDGDDIDEPWTFVISRDDFPEVVKIKARWSRKTVVDTDEALYFNPIRRFYPYRFLPDPRGGFFPMGFGKLLRRAEASADRLLAAVVDTAETESENGGVLAGGGFGVPDKIEVKGNRVTTLPTDGRPLTDSYANFPSKSVSAGSVQVLDKVITLADRLAGTLNLLENAPASMTATLAKGLIDNGTQVQSAVHRRLCASLTQEIRMFVQMADAYDQLPEGISASNADGVGVTADPQLATEMHRSAQAGVYMEMTQNPLVFHAQEAALRFCQTMRLPNPEKLIAPAVAPQATPDEKMKGALGLMKQRTENIKVIGSTAVALTTALKNLVEAAGGQLDQRMALLQMAQLEETVKQLMQEAGNANSFVDGMAQQSGNAGAGNAPPGTASAGNSDVAPGAAGGPSDAGTGGGTA